MKVFVALVCVFAICRAEMDKEFVAKFVEKIKKISEECTAETKASADDIKNVMEHKIPDTKEGKCLIFCFHKHFNVQNDDGSLNKDGAIAALEPIKEHNEELYNKFVKVFDTCGDTAKTDSDPCVYASNLAECAIKEGKSMGLDELMVIE